MIHTLFLSNFPDFLSFFMTSILIFSLLYKFYRRYSFVLRIVLLLVVAWMTLLVFNSALIVIPVSLGRAIFNSIPLLPITHGIKCNGMAVDCCGL